jgi:E3 ubiquitin-protein ligase TRIP12
MSHRIEYQSNSSIESDSVYVDNRRGLFPAPLARTAKVNIISRIRQKFQFLGKFMAKALMDSRMVSKMMTSIAFVRQ